MKKIYKIMGNIFLGIAAIIEIVGPTSVSNMAAEEMPEYLKNKR